MGRELYESEPVFREAVDRCAAVLQGELKPGLLEVMYGERGGAAGARREYTQPALFAIEYGLAELWRSWGVEPAVVLGHSVGEYAAACVAGMCTMEEGVRLIAARGRLMGELPGAKGRWRRSWRRRREVWRRWRRRGRGCRWRR